MAVPVDRAGGSDAWLIQASGGDGDAPADGPCLLKLVNEGRRVVLRADGALAVGVGQQLIAAKAVGSRPFTWRDLDWRGDVSSVQVWCLRAEQVEQGALGQAHVPVGGGVLRAVRPRGRPRRRRAPGRPARGAACPPRRVPPAGTAAHRRRARRPGPTGSTMAATAHGPPAGPPCPLPELALDRSAEQVTARGRRQLVSQAGPEAAQLGATAMIDVSDGPLADLGHITAAQRRRPRH